MNLKSGGFVHFAVSITKGNRNEADKKENEGTGLYRIYGTLPHVHSPRPCTDLPGTPVARVPCHLAGSSGSGQQRAVTGSFRCLGRSAVRRDQYPQDRRCTGRRERDRKPAFKICRIHFQRHCPSAYFQSCKDRSREPFHKRVCPGAGKLGVHPL